jgi:hypothetical protein
MLPLGSVPPCGGPESQRRVSVTEQTPKSRLGKVESGSMRTLHSAAREINYNDTEAGDDASQETMRLQL